MVSILQLYILFYSTLPPPPPHQKLDYDGGRTLEELIQYVEKRVAGEPIDEPADGPMDSEGGDGDEPGDDNAPKDEL